MAETLKPLNIDTANVLQSLISHTRGLDSIHADPLDVARTINRHEQRAKEKQDKGKDLSPLEEAVTILPKKFRPRIESKGDRI